MEELLGVLVGIQVMGLLVGIAGRSKWLALLGLGGLLMSGLVWAELRGML